MATLGALYSELFPIDRAGYDLPKRNEVEKAIGRAGKEFGNARLIEEPDFDSSRCGLRRV